MQQSSGICNLQSEICNLFDDILDLDPACHHFFEECFCGRFSFLQDASASVSRITSSKGPTIFGVWVHWRVEVLWTECLRACTRVTAALPGEARQLYSEKAELCSLSGREHPPPSVHRVHPSDDLYLTLLRRFELVVAVVLVGGHRFVAASVPDTTVFRKFAQRTRHLADV